MINLPHIPVFIIYIFIFIDFFIAFFFLSIYVSSKLRKENMPLLMKEITFVLPAYNLSSLLEKTVLSIKNSDYPQDKVHIIIVNDYSTDNTLEVAKALGKKYSRIKVFTNKENSGKAKSVNFGLSKAKTELAAVLDGDTLVKPDLIRKAVSLFSTQSTMAVTARMKPLNNSKLIERLQYIEYTFAGFYRRLIGKISALPVAPAFTIFRREFFLKYGYFDLDNLTEDLEMGLRIQSHHYNIGYVADSYAITDVPENLKKLYRQRLRWNYGTFYNYKKYKNLFFNKEYGDLGVFILPAGFISILIVSLVFLLAAYTLLVWIVDKIQMLMIGWRPAFEFDPDRFFLYGTDLRFLLFVFAFILGLTIYFLIKTELKEKIKLREYLLMMTIYLWTLAIFYIVGFYYFIIKKKPSWF